MIIWHFTSIFCATYNSVTRAWIGVNELNGPLTFVSNPERILSYAPTWVISESADATKKCVTILASNGEWEALECKDSKSNQATLCRVPPFDEYGYNLETGIAKFHFVFKCFDYSWNQVIVNIIISSNLTGKFK